ncbi:MAG: hypothetical protein NC388_02110 [Clostridium sp.]|nr:hypothetical protein [Clostridium sp.]
MKLRLLPYISVALCGLLSAIALVSCDESDDFTSDASVVLAFSSDTITFDTVITTVGSATQQIRVYNPQSKGVRIASVRLKHGQDSPFRVNVDGEFLRPENDAQAFDFELLGEDSLYVFAEVTLPEGKRNEPFLMTDSIIFRLENGREQWVVLKASGQDAWHWHGKRIEEDTILTAGRPFVVYDSLCVDEGATLTLESGVQLYFHTGADLRLRGRLDVQGTLDSPVVFRGDRTDRLFSYLPYDNTPSRWGGIHVYKESLGNRFRYADIHSATFGILCDSTGVDNEKLWMENTVVHNIGGDGITLLDCMATVVNTQVSNTLGDCIYVVGGDTEFIHCTVAQFYPWEAGRGKALRLGNTRFGVHYPLTRSVYYNCLMTGYGDDVMQGEWDSETDDQWNYYFANSLLNTETADDEQRFVNILYDNGDATPAGESQFKLFDTYNFLYDFRPKPDSRARNLGDPSVALYYPTDYYGIDRTRPVAPTAGCYEVQEAEE